MIIPHDFYAVKGFPNELFESKFTYSDTKVENFGVLYDGLIIYDSFPSGYQFYYKIQGSNMLLSEGRGIYIKYNKSR